MSKQGQEELKESQDGCSGGERDGVARGSQSERVGPHENVRTLFHPKSNEKTENTGV